jgi:arylsulfatase A-like enzyme
VSVALRLLALVFLAANTTVGCARDTARPNLLLVTVDTLRPDYLSCYGGKLDVGTRMCSLASEGTRFVWAFSTAPVTAPAVASVLTSTYPSQHGVTQHVRTALPDEITTIAEVLSEAGYSTGAFVSNPVLVRQRNLGQGFHVYDDRMSRRERNRPEFVERTAELTTEAALTWVKSAAPPWFLWVHYQDPHGPYDPPGAEPVSDDPAGRPLPVLDDQSGRGGIPAYQVLPGARTMSQYARRYVEEIRYLDRHFGDLLDAVDALGTRPAVLLTADHGEAFGEDGYYFAHGHSLGIDQIRVPLIWRPSEPTDPREYILPVSVLDAAPSLVRAAGLKLEDSFEGQPLQALGSEGSVPRTLFAEQGLRIAVIEGLDYYGRDRVPFQQPERDHMTRSLSYPLSARTARLSSDGLFPSYVSVGDSEVTAHLESTVRGFLEAARNHAEPKTADVPPEIREQLRALGYAD